jgi:hypothetical protein
MTQLALRAPPVAEWDDWIAVGEHAANAGISQPLHRGVSMFGRQHDVRPIQHSGDAGIDGAKGSEQIADIDIVRAIARRHRLQDDFQINEKIPFRNHRAELRLPGVPVGVDQTGKNELVGCIDHVGVGARQIGAHRLDPATVDQHVAGLELADRLVARDHVPALED